MSEQLQRAPDDPRVVRRLLPRALASAVAAATLLGIGLGASAPALAATGGATASHYSVVHHHYKHHKKHNKKHHKKHKKDPATIDVCKGGSVNGSFSFTVDGGKAFSLSSGNCKSVTTTSGQHTVVEMPDATGATFLSAINVSPAADQVRQSLASGSVVVKVPANADVTTQFINSPAMGTLKVCKIAGDPSLNGQEFSFTETAGGSVVGPFSVAATPAGSSTLNCGGLTSYPVGTMVNIAELPTANVAATSITVTNGTASNLDLANGTVTATVGGAGTTIVTYTNTPVVSGAPGSIEVCKQAGDAYVSGTWSFTISNGSGTTITTSASTTGPGNVGCSGDFSVPAGNYTITEAETSPYYVSAVSAIPSGDLVSQNLGNATATFSVASGAATTAFFTNSTSMGYLKVCKTLAGTSSNALAGQSFTFNVSDAAGTQTLTVVAPAYGATNCTFDSTPLPVGSMASITEASSPNVTLTGVTVSPASQDGGSTNTTANLIISGTEVTAATFTNMADGWVEVCNYGSDATASAQSNTFTVNGGAPFSVQANGSCGPAQEVPAGTAVVDETVNPGFVISNITTVSITDPTGSRLLTGPTQNPATVSVPYGGVQNETIVSYTNDTLAGEFKICEGQSSFDAGLAGDYAQFSYGWTVNGVSTTSTVAILIPASGLTCTGLIGVPGILTLNSDLSPVPVYVTQTAVTTDQAGANPVADILTESILYQGGGTVTYNAAANGPTADPASICWDLGSGMQQITFTNGRSS